MRIYRRNDRGIVHLIQSFIHASNPYFSVEFFQLLSLDDVDCYTYPYHDYDEFNEPKIVFLLLFFGLAGQVQLYQNFCETNSCKGNLLIGDLRSYSQIVLRYCRFIIVIVRPFELSFPRLVNLLVSILVSLVGPVGNFTGKIILYNQPTGENVGIGAFVS